MASGQRAGRSDTPSLSRSQGGSSELSPGSTGWSRGAHNRGACARLPAPCAPSPPHPHRHPHPGAVTRAQSTVPAAAAKREDLFTARARPPASVEKILTVPQINTLPFWAVRWHQIISGL